MDATSLPDEWEVAVGPRSEPRYFNVPDAGLQEFLRTLASQGAVEFRISGNGWIFRIEQMAGPPPGTGCPR